SFRFVYYMMFHRFSGAECQNLKSMVEVFGCNYGKGHDFFPPLGLCLLFTVHPQGIQIPGHLRIGRLDPGAVILAVVAVTDVLRAEITVIGPCFFKIRLHHGFFLFPRWPSKTANSRQARLSPRPERTPL